MNSPSSQLAKKSLEVHRRSLSNRNTFNVLQIQWVFFLYFFVLIFSLTQAASSSVSQQLTNARIAIYSLIFLLNQSIMVTEKVIAIQDPLQTGITLVTLKYVTITLHANMIYLMFRIILQLKTIAFFVVLHYTLNFWINKQFVSLIKNLNEVGISKITKLKAINPLILYTFSKTLYGQADISEISLLFLILFGVNLFLTSQIKRISFLSQTQYFGWMTVDKKDNFNQFFNRKWGLKTIMLVTCVILVLQNMLLIFNVIRKDISLAIIHTLLIGLSSYYLYSRNIRI